MDRPSHCCCCCCMRFIMPSMVSWSDSMSKGMPHAIFCPGLTPMADSTTLNMTGDLAGPLLAPAATALVSVPDVVQSPCCALDVLGPVLLVLAAVTSRDSSSQSNSSGEVVPPIGLKSMILTEPLVLTYTS